MRVQTFEVQYLHTAVRYFKLPKDVSGVTSNDIAFKDGCLVFEGETYAPERETLVKREPYAVRWDLAWINLFDPDRPEDEAPTSTGPRSLEEMERDYQEHGRPMNDYVIAHHHVAVTKRATVTDDTPAGRTAQGIIDDYPNVDELEFTFIDDRAVVEFDNHEGGPLTCSLEEISRSTKPDPHAVYRGDGKLLTEDESWTMFQERTIKWKERVKELVTCIDLMEERDKRRRMH